MLNITVHHDTDLSREEIVAVLSLICSFWPSKEKSVPELVETFPEIGRQYRASYPQIRIPSLRYVVWNENKAVAHGLTFERPVITNAGEISVMALSGVCVLPSYQGKGLGAEIHAWMAASVKRLGVCVLRGHRLRVREGVKWSGVFSCHEHA
jgi:hypothetical protein